MIQAGWRCGTGGTGLKIERGPSVIDRLQSRANCKVSNSTTKMETYVDILFGAK
jgi:hypothetical protein